MPRKLLCVLPLLALSCSPATYLNNTTSLGGNNPGQRGNIMVQFENRTPFRAIFTYGSYDPQNQQFGPQFGQFFASTTTSQRLEGNTISPVFTFDCGRAFSLGGQQLIEYIRKNNLTQDTDPEALVPGITFSDRPVDDPEAEAPTAGRADPVTNLQGVDYPCDALLIYTLNLDDTQPSGFRIDMTVVVP